MKKISKKLQKEGLKMRLLKQPRFHVEYFMTRALLVGISEFMLAPYPKNLVLGMLVMWQSFMLLSSM